MVVFHIKSGDPDSFTAAWPFSGHASQAFQREAFKKQYEKCVSLWERSIAPPHQPHGSTAAFRADGQVNVPDGFEKFRHGQPCITLPESLSSLKFKDHFQVS